MSAVDCEIKGVMSGFLVACLIITIIQGQRPKPVECIAEYKDINGAIHEMHGVIRE